MVGFHPVTGHLQMVTGVMMDIMQLIHEVHHTVHHSLLFVLLGGGGDVEQQVAGHT
jgi:hypothetical protein